MTRARAGLPLPGRAVHACVSVRRHEERPHDASRSAPASAQGVGFRVCGARRLRSVASKSGEVDPASHAEVDNVEGVPVRGRQVLTAALADFLLAILDGGVSRR
jgi:hypothetical protein